MLQSFITSLDPSQSNKKNNSERQETYSSKQAALKGQIKLLIDNMPSSQVTAQAALNIGLPSNLLDFNKLFKKIEPQSNLSSLTFTLTQLNALYKESMKLTKTAKKTIQSYHSPQIQPKNVLQTNKPSSQSLKLSILQKKENHFQQKLLSTIKGQISFRIKVKNFYSTQKIEKKDEFIKQRIERVRNMNKKVSKVFKTYKSKQKSQIDSFKIPTDDYLAEKSNKEPVMQNRIRKQRFVTNLCDFVVSEDMQDYQQGGSNYKRYNTAETGRRFGCIKQGGAMLENRESQMRFFQRRQKQFKVKEKKRQIEMQKEDMAIYRMIKKQQRLNLISSEKENKALSKIALKNKPPPKQNLVNQCLQKTVIKAQLPNLQAQITNRCQQKAFKKELILQQKVNKIRQQLKVKEERVAKHRLNIQTEHQNNLEFNEQYLKTYNQKIKSVKFENDLKHELTIRSRIQNGLQNEKQEKILLGIPKMNENELKKYLQKLSGKGHFQSHKYIN